MGTTSRWRDPRVAVMAVCTFLAAGVMLVGRVAFAQSGAVVTGSVFVDSDGDGTWDTDEVSKAGVPLWVIGRDASISASTGEDGTFVVDTGAIGAGPYGVLVGALVDASGAAADPGSAVAVALPDGLSWTNPGPHHFGNWVMPVGGPISIGLTTCTSTGSCPGVSVGDSVWFDADADGLQDPGEAPIGGAQVEVSANGVVIGSTATNGSGQWSISDPAVGAGLTIEGLSGYGEVTVKVTVPSEVAAGLGASGWPGEFELRAAPADLGFDQVDSDGGDAGADAAQAAVSTARISSDLDFGFVLSPVPVKEAPATTEPDPAVVVPTDEPTSNPDGSPSPDGPDTSAVEPAEQNVDGTPPVDVQLDQLPVDQTTVAPAPTDQTDAAAAAQRRQVAVASMAQAPGVEQDAMVQSETGPAAGASEPTTTSTPAVTAIVETTEPRVEVLSARSSAEVAQDLSTEPDEDGEIVAVGRGDIPILAEIHDRSPVRYGGDVVAGSTLPRTGTTVTMFVSFAIMLIGLGLVLMIGSSDDIEPRVFRNVA